MIDWIVSFRSQGSFTAGPSNDTSIYKDHLLLYNVLAEKIAFFNGSLSYYFIQIAWS